MHQDLALEIRQDSFGNKFLYFPFMTISDVHLGTRHCRAERLSRMLEHTVVDQFSLIGDIVDGEYMKRKRRWKFGPAENNWHRQVLAHICRKVEHGTKVTYIPGNHDIAIRNQKVTCDSEERPHRNLCGKNIYGINVVERAYYTDSLNRKFLLIHGDQYDRTLGKCSTFGDAALEVMQYIDGWFQRLPKCAHISLAAKGKRAVKTVVDKIWSIREQISKEVDEDPSLHGTITGHSHMSEISRTPGGKFLINDGCCTENVEAVVIDRRGTMAVLEWHKTYLKVKQENGQSRIYMWNELGLDSFREKPQLIEDENTVRADRLIRLFFRMWPPQQRRHENRMRDFVRTGGEINEHIFKPSLFYNLCPPLKRRRIIERNEMVQAAKKTTAYIPIAPPVRKAAAPQRVNSLNSTSNQALAA